MKNKTQTNESIWEIESREKYKTIPAFIIKEIQEQAVKEEAEKWKTVCMYACDIETWERIRNGLHALNKPL
jgi:hypothetical protein